MFKKVILCPNAISAFAIFSLFISGAAAQQTSQATDSVHAKHLREVVVNGQKSQTTRAALPVQILSGKELTTLNATSVADVAKHFAGVTVKDYGGIGGLKTVSVRGLSATHTGVSYDGVMMSDIQSGQIDLSQFCVDNIESVSLHNGQPINLLQSARMFSSSSVLSLTTKTPAYNQSGTLSGHVALNIGSFGLINPSLLIYKHINRHLAVNLALNSITTNGNYPFELNINPYGKNIVHLTRNNTAVKNLRTELNIIYQFSTNESLKFKTNHYYSDRELPGAVTSYNYYEAKGKMNDQNWLSQFYYENKKSTIWQYFISGKYNRQNMKYSNVSNNYTTSDHTLRETYLQNEYYLSSAVQFHPVNKLTIAATTDYWFNNLFSTSSLSSKKDAKPIRNTVMANLSAKYVTEKFSIGGNILYAHAHGNADTTNAKMNYNNISPTIFTSYQPFRNQNLIFRAFYKDVYRLPTFTELYYHDMGYKNLKPEKDHQYNIGITYQTDKTAFLSHIAITADAFYNAITNKITTIYGIPFSSVRNIGKVKVKGIDISVQASKNINQHNCVSLTANYNYQLAQNYDVIPETYGDILDYSPIHSGSASLTYSHKKFDGGYNMLFAGKRYSGQNSYKLYYLAPYVDQSVFGRLNFKHFSIMAEVINFMDANYQIVQYYPMPGRNYKFSVNYKF